MKIVQSFWSKPALAQPLTNQMLSRAGGGWRSPKHHYLAWVLSCMQLSTYYDAVELVTDEAGKRLLIDELQLPYTSVRVELDALNPYDASLWAIGKLWAYAVQTAPFLHVDSDVFIWGPFPEAVGQAPLLVQGIDSTDLTFYSLTLSVLADAGFWLPPEIRAAHRTGSFRSISAGVFGGTDLAFIHEYSRQAIAFADRNQDKLARINVPGIGPGMFNLIYEQLYGWCLAEAQHRRVTVLLPDYTSTDSCCRIADFQQVYEKKTTYIHLAGYKRKQDEAQCRVLENLVRHYYPAYYERVLELTGEQALLAVC